MSIPSNKGYATTPLKTAVNVSPFEVLTNTPILLKGLLASKETGLVALIIFIVIVWLILQSPEHHSGIWSTVCMAFLSNTRQSRSTPDPLASTDMHTILVNWDSIACSLGMK